ncbi:MAG: RecQ family ATP-dependent DNA helicase, partial [Deltaproteobacteria bacterium]
MTLTRNQAEDLLLTRFRLNRFYDEQWETIESLLEGKRILLIQRTGFGKSLCYQLPALKMSGITLVISPLIALMKDQVDSLIACGAQAAFINSSLTAEQIKQVYTDLKNNKIKILYCAPERFAISSFQAFLNTLNISLIAVDEAHCISEWG